jgi:hypothetical protein
MTAPQHHDDPVSGLPGAIQVVGRFITLISFAAKTCPASLQLQNPPEPVSIAFLACFRLFDRGSFGSVSAFSETPGKAQARSHF